MPRSRSAGEAHPADGILLAALALAVAAFLFILCLAGSPASGATFHSCATQKLENQGIFQLKASHAKCKLARQTANARRNGDSTPKGFSCVTGAGGNLTPFTCTRQQQIVKFSLEG